MAKKIEIRLTPLEKKVREELQEGCTRPQLERYAAAFMDGKSYTIPPKFIKSIYKETAKGWSTDQLLDYLAKKWEV